MNQKMNDFVEKISQFWKQASKKNKTFYIGTFILLVAILSTAIFFLAKPNLVPLYSNSLSQKEIGEIKGVLEKQGVKDYKITNNGTQILVPKEAVADLVVNLAASGYPKGGPISFTDQTKDLKFGVTDRELDAIEREVIQGQLANLMTKISGVEHAEVMITLPKESVFIRPEEEGKASASIIVNLEPGYELEKQQIKALYHLASKSIPDLPEENIVITDQNGQLLNLPNSENAGFEGMESYETQRDIKQKVEADIQHSIQQLLGTMLGQDKVLVQTFVKLNFDKVKTQQNLVEPLNGDTDKGIAVSVEEVTKSYSGEGAVPGGVDGTGDGDVPGYTAEGSAGKNDYQEKVNRVNYEVNRITKEMVENPYSIEDLTINVGIEPPNPKNPASLTPETQENIRNILANVVRTAIKDNNDITNADLNNRITVFPREFAGKKDLAPAQADEQTIDSYLNYILIGAAALLLLVGGLVIAAVVRRKKKNEIEPQSEFLEVKKLEEFEPIINKKESVQKELTQLAGKNTEEFVDLLRYWLKEEKEG